MAITKGNLPYDKSALEPFISGRTVDFHYGKHHATYETNANKLLEGTGLQNEHIETILSAVSGNPEQAGLFNNVAQVWNHTFYWSCLKPKGGGPPIGKIADLIKSSFGGYDQFLEQFQAAAMSRFGSGWAWLVMPSDQLEIMTTANADTPIARGIRTLFTVDVWEHAYYLDYKNKRADYLEAVMRNLVNWEFVNSRLE